jgi:TonB family protein
MVMPHSRILRLSSYCVAVMLSCIFCSPLQADDAEGAKLPKFKPGALGYYPNAALRLSQQGRVLVEFEISPEGRAVDLTITSSEPQGVFDKTVTMYVLGGQFDVPSDWETSGGTHRRYHMSFLFLLRPCRATGPCEELAPFPADGSVTVTRPPLALAHQR